MIHAGSLKTSKKLQSIVKALEDGRWHSAREIRELSGGEVEAVSARIQELTAPVNNLNIECKYIVGQYRYRLLPASPVKKFNDCGDFMSEGAKVCTRRRIPEESEDLFEFVKDLQRYGRWGRVRWK